MHQIIPVSASIYSFEGRTQVSKFPKFSAHDKAYCFNCGADFGDGWYSLSGYADGRGKFVQSCSKCNMSTWYDLDDPVVAAVYNFLIQPTGEL
jgi:hypothetical protein